jgi:NADH-quinone oxidoreductase subunit L
VLCGVFVTSLYTFRMLFLTFHGPERFRDAAHAADSQDADAHAADAHAADALAAGAHDVGAHDAGDHDAGAHGSGHGADPHESPAVVTVPLIALAIPSVVIGALTVGPVLFGNYYGHSIFVLADNDVLAKVGADFGGAVQFALHGLTAPPFLLALAGAVTAWVFFLRRPALAGQAAQTFHWLYRTLVQKYYFDWFNDKVIATLTRLIGFGLWKGGDQVLIDGALVNGTAEGVSWFGGLLRRVQSGYLYSYAFWMMIGLAVLLGWFLTHARP